jgi:hypothetical protein
VPTILFVTIIHVFDGEGCAVSSYLEDFFSDDSLLAEEPGDTVYCPYTNSAECALLVKGWQPQELCLSLDCEQLKFFQHANGQHDRAA